MFLRWFIILGFVWAALLASPFARAASSSPCPPYTTPITLNFKTLNPAPIYNNRLSIQGIRNLFRDRDEPVSGPHEQALGITYAESVYSVETHTLVREVNGGFCVYLSSIDLDFGWKRQDVYIASEFQPGTCEYRTVLDHENQHVSVNNSSLKEFAPYFRAQVEKSLQTQQPVFARSGDAGTDVAMKAVEKGMSALMTQFHQINGQRNAPLDSASNYEATAGLCKNWNLANPPQRR